jgi:octopine/nopaline transport system substrate-binding protein
MKSWIGVAAALAMTVCAPFSSAVAKEWTSIIIASEGAYPPFNYMDADGKLAGFDIDVAEALCKAAKVECTIVAQDWDGMIPGLTSKKYDAIIAQMSITEERKRAIDFTDYYCTTPAVLVGKDGMHVDFYKDGKLNTAALDGLAVGAQRSTIHSNFLEDNFSKGDIRLYDTQDNANLDLLAGRIDATLADSGVLLDWLKTPDAKGYAIVSDTLSDPKWFGDGAGIGIRQGEDDLKALFNSALKTILADGTYEAINKKYLPEINLHPRP